MNLEYYIAKRIAQNKAGGKYFSRHMSVIAVSGISLGMVVMILSIAIVTGFKNQIREKVIGFGGHITITNYDSNISYDTKPVDKNQDFYPAITNLPGIKHIQRFAIKPGIMKVNDNIHAVIVKGVDNDFDWDFFEKNLIEGETFRVNDSTKSNQIVISSYIAKLLKIKINDKIHVYFPQNPPRARSLVVSGIYETGLEELDKIFIIADIKHIQKLYNWDDSKISGFEILVDNYDDIEKLTDEVFYFIGYQFEEGGSALKIRNIKQNYPHIFDWLDLTDTNVWVILIIMSLVAAGNMITGLLIIILERTNMIGILKSLGMANNSIQKLFLYNAFLLISKGILWGNAIGLLLCFIQSKFSIISLDPSSYYVSTVPININVPYIVLLNIGAILLMLAIQIIPTNVIARISPIKAIRFN